MADRGQLISVVCLLAEEPVEDGNEAIGLLDVGQVAAVRDELERALSEAGERFSRLRGREHPLGCTPNDERRHLQAGKPVQQHLALPPEVGLGSQRGQFRLQEARQ
jgi:hypothetical protein